MWASLLAFNGQKSGYPLYHFSEATANLFWDFINEMAKR